MIGWAGGGLTVHQLGRHPGGLIANLHQGQADAGNRHTGQPAEHLVVIHAQDGDIVGNGIPQFAYFAGNMKGQNVVAGKQRHRFGQLPQ